MPMMGAMLFGALRDRMIATADFNEFTAMAIVRWRNQPRCRVYLLMKIGEPLTDEMIEAENDSIYHDASNSRDYSWKAGAAWARDHYESIRVTPTTSARDEDTALPAQAVQPPPIWDHQGDPRCVNGGCFNVRGHWINAPDSVPTQAVGDEVDASQASQGGKS
jgi:hypothetical protein